MDGSTLSNLSKSESSDASTRVVDIIVPVYSGLAEVRACLESVLSSSSDSQGEVIVINDCSPEPAIDRFLKGLERESRITLLENDENLGFVKSCNRAADLRPDNDFVFTQRGYRSSRQLVRPAGRAWSHCRRYRQHHAVL